ncbi:MAG TPA: GNAT family N-acetyltransferase [Steroidobacteraceae bacterium]|nr:GNAT family N-acetyltransferase [Steroidobacteraceae bacterium]
MSALTARRWTSQQWLASESAWDGLLLRSRSDRLFMSWQWLTHWWQYYGAVCGLTAEILAFYRGDSLVGLAPLYHRPVVRAGIVPARSVQLIGLTWRDSGPLISEYLDAIALPEELDAVRRQCVQVLLQAPAWTELVIGFTAAGAEWREAFLHAVPARGRHYARELDRSVSYHADLGQGFDAYLKDLGQSTRRSVWNLRRRLAQEHGEVRCELLGADELDSGFDDLNRLHQLRWNRPAFAGERLEFHKRFAAQLAVRGELAFTRLRVAGNVVSVLYDIRKGTRQYNMKMGFDPAFTTRLSLGLIHFGYAMEAAAEHGVTLYDFLAGPGQTYDFKRNLGHIRRDLSCMQMLRGHVLPAFFRWRDRARLQDRAQEAAQPTALREGRQGSGEHGD